MAHTVATPSEQAFLNIIQVGLGMADPKLARILVEDAVASRSALLNWGATFGDYGIRSDGAPIMEALIRQIRSTNVSVRERTMIASLLVPDGECLGAIGVDEMNGDIFVIRVQHNLT